MLTDFRSGELVFRWSGGNSGQRGGGIEQPDDLGVSKVTGSTSPGGKLFGS